MIPKETKGKISSIEIRPTKGSSITLEKESSDYSSLLRLLDENAKPRSPQRSDFGASASYLRMDSRGKIFSGYGDGKNEKPVKLGQKLEFNFDVGDRRPDWQKVQVSWAKSLDGKSVLLNGMELKPVSAINTEWFRPAWN